MSSRIYRSFIYRNRTKIALEHYSKMCSGSTHTYTHTKKSCGSVQNSLEFDILSIDLHRRFQQLNRYILIAYITWFTCFNTCFISLQPLPLSVSSNYIFKLHF